MSAARVSRAAGALVEARPLGDVALYELAYEMENRPDWVGIPLRGLVELLQSGD